MQMPRANVYDLRTLQSPPDFKYFLDTNVLKFIFARTSVHEQSYQTEYYPAFFKELLKRENIIRFTFTQNILELFSVLDAIEKELKSLPTIKDYRSDDLEQYLDSRRNIFEEIGSSLQVFPIKITPDDVTSYLNIDFSIDVKDYIYYRHANDTGTAFVTDDLEFIYIEGITVFTANDKAIQAAKRFGKLRS